ncbi:hypothetical protein AVEN_13457-1 [Araneus ventricosus]|uniref:Uncharacterized protein n=1 Tax=Araneus ventricosus TaxID=182803 RepID=A0A4Y2PYG5_ARAVE|nr:hypothetical protein AVEN_13457-1 [Araneus ventricosus]
MGCGKDNWTPTALISEVISEPHLPSEEANRIRSTFVAVKEKFLDRLTRCERVNNELLAAIGQADRGFPYFPSSGTQMQISFPCKSSRKTEQSPMRVAIPPGRQLKKLGITQHTQYKAQFPLSVVRGSLSEVRLVSRRSSIAKNVVARWFLGWIDRSREISVNAGHQRPTSRRTETTVPTKCCRSCLCRRNGAAGWSANDNKSLSVNSSNQGTNRGNKA